MTLISISLSVLAFLILLTMTIIIIQNKHKRKGLPLEPLEKLAIYLDIFAASVYIILAAINSIMGFHLKIPSDILWAILIVLIISVIATLIISFKQRSSIVRLNGVMAYLFFPEHITKDERTLEYHKKHFHKKIIVNLNKNPAQAYYLSDSEKNYPWKMISKYDDLWTPITDENYPNAEVTTWCKDKEYHFNPWSASKLELFDSFPSLNSELLTILKERQQNGKFDNLRIVFLVPWYRFHSSGNFA